MIPAKIRDEIQTLHRLLDKRKMTQFQKNRLLQIYRTILKQEPPPDLVSLHTIDEQPEKLSPRESQKLNRIETKMRFRQGVTRPELETFVELYKKMGVKVTNRFKAPFDPDSLPLDKLGYVDFDALYEDDD